MSAELPPLADFQTRDVARIRARFPAQTAGLTDGGIAAAYSYWSEGIPAGWLMLHEYAIDQFAAYAFAGAPPAMPYMEWRALHEVMP